ncbi:CopG family transcriptional regulator [Marinomonas rhizomae]|uniref:CopG family transcriptional regulator n=1 Tax=Marinomonas rhizomae TaxID=491948 RepID=A0A366JBU0_9GAMM|nr:CopG family transcriptional regulator [Marinomonas rhizomae]RBP84307.1 hypothetical protein DFP80_104210 [Marinomonas rhizomae]RNF74626.1 CopG family transcriptional regulator [Marinomonas rhizomae]
MNNLSKRSTVYFEPDTLKALKMRAASSDVSVSELIDEAVRLLQREDQEDLADISERVNEPEMTYEDFQSELKINGKI